MVDVGSACSCDSCICCHTVYHGISHYHITADIIMISITARCGLHAELVHACLVVDDWTLCGSVAVKELREEYLAADTVTRKHLEQRYGRKNIQKLVEDSFSEDWLSNNAKQCPQCAAHIQVSTLSSLAEVPNVVTSMSVCLSVLVDGSFLEDWFNNKTPGSVPLTLRTCTFTVIIISHLPCVDNLCGGPAA